MPKVLIIDDDPGIGELLCRMVRRMEHDAETVATLRLGREAAASGGYDVVFLDVRLPDGNGLEAIDEIRRSPSRPEVIIMTGQGDPDGAELAIKNGAWDYIEKPSSVEKMKLPLMRALDFRGERDQTQGPRLLRRSDIVGESPALMEALELLAQAAGSEANALITGETGTGKELWAREIHANSRRRDNNFVVVDCAALPETLVESLLFGHVKGSFTGADKRQRGLIEQADKGTLFLDEVGELPMTLQKPFLRVLQERRFRPLGADFEVSSDFRLIAATNKNLEVMSKKGDFRNDLFFRLRSFPIELPPLRDHISDVPDLVNFHVARICSRYGIRPKGYSPDLLEALMAYHWPGNVRELVNVLERSIATAQDEPILYPYHLPIYLRVELARASVGRRPPAAAASGNGETPARAPRGLGSLKETREAAVEEAERRYLHDLMELTQGDIKRSCNISELSRGRLYALLKKYNIRRPHAD